MSDAVRKKQGGRALFDEIGGIAAEEAGVAVVDEAQFVKLLGG